MINRIFEIDKEVYAIAAQNGYEVFDIINNPEDKPISVLKAVHVLLEEKLKIQKTLFEQQGGDLSNVVFLSERRR